MSGDRRTVTFLPGGARVSVEPGATLLEAAVLAGELADAPCGGLGTCGRCAVTATGGLDEPSADELTLLTPEQLAAGMRLSCRAHILGDATVRVTAALGAPPAPEPGAERAVTVEPPEARGIRGEEPLVGAAVDIGTTTVVAAVVDLRSGRELGRASVLNPQHPFGHDVMSRISHAAVHGTDALREPILGAVTTLVLGILAAAGAEAGHLREIEICGNTTMIHLLLGLDPAPLGAAPYGPAFVSSVQRPASEIGLTELGTARAHILPGVSAFIGSDITAGLVATGLAEREAPAVFADLGTNGEIVVRTREGVVAGSTAAGPALEGASIAYGMRAEDGAIERVTLRGDDLRLVTIGGGEPRGLCGSGLLDLIAVLLEAGVLDASGRMRPDAAHPLAARVSDDDVRSFRVAPGVLLTQRDVREVQLAKAAIASGIELLLDEAGIAADDVSELVLAGGFGHHVDPRAVVRMGMIPAAWVGRVRFAGNTALAGATLALLDSAARRRAAAISRHVRAIDLAARPDFETRFVGAMGFPATGSEPV